MANAGAWINAANNAVNKAVRARKAIADKAVDYSDLGRAAIRADAAEEVDAVKANLAVGDAVLTEATRSKLADIDSDLTDSIVDIKKNERKAGLLAAGAGLMGAGYILKNRKVDPNPMIAEYDLLRSKYDNQISQNDLDIIAKKQALADISTQINNLGSSTTVASPSTSQTVSPTLSANHSALEGGKLSKPDILNLALSSGFTPQQAQDVVGIAGGESGYDASNSTIRSGLYQKEGEDSVGLMQINWGYHKDKGWLQDLGINKREDLFDPVKNMKAAKYLHSGRGGFQDWTVYNTGDYLDFK